jgi:hypothetical protein
MADVTSAHGRIPNSGIKNTVGPGAGNLNYRKLMKLDSNVYGVSCIYNVSRRCPTDCFSPNRLTAA